MNKRDDLLILLAYPIIGAFLCYLLKINAFGSIIVFFGIPSLYLTLRNPKYFKKSIIFSLILGIPSIIIIDYIAHLTGQWLIPNSILPFRLFNFVSIEVIFWAIMNVYCVVTFYEYFMDRRLKNKVIEPHLKFLFVLLLLVIIVFLGLYYIVPNLLYIPYFYLCFGITLILIPSILHFIKHPKLILRFFETAAYFFFLTSVYEITALKLGWWNFPSKQFIGWIRILDVRFPVEELMFWLILFTVAVLTFYEYFDDDEK
jgi:hypothetical protein